jgi:predicted Zn-dependent protease
MKLARTLLIVLVACGCATNPATGRRQVILMSEAEEVQLGKQSDAEVRKQMGLYEDAELQQYVRSVGDRLARAAHRPALPWSFAVVDEPAVNAFALPGGYIYLTRGIMPFLRDEAELAAVMGHEIGHVDARHQAAAYSRQTLAGGGLAILGILVPETQPLQGVASVAFGLMFLKHGREDELEADRLGVGYSAASGWDPQGMTGLLGTLARLDEASGSRRGVPNWALTHPPAADRVTKVEEAVTTSKTSSSTATNKSQFERALDGVVFGDSREKGIVRGNDFLHPVLGFALRFPQGWDIVNTNEQVVARENEESNVAIVLQLATASGNVQQAAQTGMAKAGFRETSGQRTDINGLPAYVGLYEGVMNNTRVAVRAAHIQAGGRVYLVAGVAPASQFNRADDSFQRAILSFRTLSRQEAERIQPNRVDFYVARQGDTWESIARGPANGTVRAATLAIMNGRDAATQPKAGERLRIVVSGN